MIALLVEKGVIASFRDVDPYSGAIKVHSTRRMRHCACTCEIQLLNASFHTPSFSFLWIYKKPSGFGRNNIFNKYIATTATATSSSNYNRHCTSVIFYIFDVLIIIFQFYFYTCVVNINRLTAFQRCFEPWWSEGKTPAFIRCVKSHLNNFMCC